MSNIPIAKGERKLFREIGGGATPAGITIVSRPSESGIEEVPGDTYGAFGLLVESAGKTDEVGGVCAAVATITGVAVCGAGRRGTAGSK